MKHQEEVVAILLEIIGHGLLHIRSAGWSGDAKTCAAIADRVHNLPSLCHNFSVKRHQLTGAMQRPVSAGAFPCLLES